MTQEELIREVGKVIPNGVYSEEVIQLAFTMFTHGYEYSVEKACKCIGIHLGMALSCYPIDIDVLAKDKFVGKFVDCIRAAMEE